jgi:hypothetical protein
MLRLVSRRFAGSAGEALETLGNLAQQAQHVNGYLKCLLSEIRQRSQLLEGGWGTRIRT